MNNTDIPQRLVDELTLLRQHLLDSLSHSNQDYHQQLLIQLKVSSPALWLDLTANKLGPEYQNLIKRLEKLEAAMCQIEIGQYGYCCDCEEKIDEQRLQADPASQRCKNCAP